MPKQDKGYEAPRRVPTYLAPDDRDGGKKAEWHGLEIVGPVKNISPKLWDLGHLTALYLNKNNLARLPADISRLKNLVHLDLSDNKLRSLPVELGDMVQLKELLLLNNCLRVLPYELGRLFQLNTLGLAGNPLMADYMSMVNEPGGTTRLISFLLDNLQVCPRPPTREWIDVSPQDTPQVGVRFSAMSYNILCDRYATPQLYGYCPSWSLAWDYRKEHILKEMIDSLADVIALQEVETDQFYNYFLPHLSQQGYGGIFQPKSRAKTMDEHDKKFVDGCSIFYHKTKFHLVSEVLVEFNQLAMAHSAGSSDMLNRVMLRDNIGLVALFQVKEAPPHSAHAPAPPQHLLVANAHIHWDPEYRDVKLIQMIMFMSELEAIVAKVTQELKISQQSPVPNAPGIPLLLCGDFNSLPKSSVIDYLTKARVYTDHEDLQDFCYHGYTSRVSSSSGGGGGGGVHSRPQIAHRFPLQSAYQDHHMAFSNYTHGFKGVIDYIFYSQDFLQLQGLLGPVDRQWFQQWKVIGCPNPHYPSDHFPLLCQLELAPPK